MLEAVKNYILGEWQQIGHAPATFVMLAVVIALAVWGTFNWGYGRIIENQGSEIRLLERQVKDYERQVDLLQKKPATVVAGDFSNTADLVLQIYSDERTPTRMSYENIWRWYYLRTIMIGVEVPAGKEHRAVIATLFVTFDKPVNVGTLEISAQGFSLPTYEVKEFTNRYAIVVFSSEPPAGTLHLRVYN